MPAAASLSPEGREWIKETLILCGFELQPDGSLRASDDTLDQLRGEQNTARRQVHAEAAAAREALLTTQLKALSAASPEAAAAATTLGLGRAALRDFLFTFDGQPAAGPFLLGVAALLRTQALSGTSTAHQWRLERAAVLNGGDEFVRRAVPLLRALGLCVGGDAGGVDLEGGNGADDDTIVVEVASATWTAGEMAALAAHIERRCARQPFGGRATGRVDAGARAFEPRALVSWSEWLGSVLAALLLRMTP